jgi:ubiquinone biosynthesis protein Coq4
METEEMAVTREWISKHASAATDTHTMIEELLEAMFSMQSLQKLYKAMFSMQSMQKVYKESQFEL